MVKIKQYMNIKTINVNVQTKRQRGCEKKTSNRKAERCFVHPSKTAQRILRGKQKHQFVHFFK